MRNKMQGKAAIVKRIAHFNAAISVPPIPVLFCRVIRVHSSVIITLDTN